MKIIERVAKHFSPYSQVARLHPHVRRLLLCKALESGHCFDGYVALLQLINLSHEYYVNRMLAYPNAFLILLQLDLDISIRLSGAKLFCSLFLIDNPMELERVAYNIEYWSSREDTDLIRYEFVSGKFNYTQDYYNYFLMRILDTEELRYMYGQPVQYEVQQPQIEVIEIDDAEQPNEEPEQSDNMVANKEPEKAPCDVSDLPESPQIRIEPKDSLDTHENQPVLQLYRENFKKAANILRGRSKKPDNCTSLVKAFIDYLRSGKMPTQPAPINSASFKELTFVWNSEHLPKEIKLEPGITHPSAEVPTIETITHSHIDRNTIFGSQTPLDEIFREENGQIDLTIPSSYDKDRSTQKSVMYTELNEALQNEAKSNGGVSFGMVSMAPCGEFIATSLWHNIVYFATPHKAVYIDCQQNQNKRVFDNLEDNFVFVGNHQQVDKDTFGIMVFYTPLGPTLANNKAPLAKAPTVDLPREKTTSVTGKRKRDTENENKNNNTKRQRFNAPDEPLNLDASIARTPSMFGPNHLYRNDKNDDVVHAMDIDSEDRMANSAKNT